MNWLLDLMGYNTAPSPYTRADWMMDTPKDRPAGNMMRLAGMTENEIRDLERKRTLPKKLQLELLDRRK